MNRSIIIGALGLLLAVAAGTAFGQAVNLAKLKINGSVGLDSTYSQVVKALGKPTKDGKATDEACIGAHEKTVDYAGLSFYFMDGDSRGGKTFEVKSFSVTSSKWLVSGVRVGDTPAVVKAKFGAKYRLDRRTDGGGLAWHYEMDDKSGPGTTTVIFKKGKVVEINSAFMMC
jgi:hypothetical protein